MSITPITSHSEGEETVKFTPETIIAIRKATGLTQVRFALLLDMDTSAISTWERGLNHPGPRARERLQEVVDDLAAKGEHIGDAERHSPTA